MNDRPCSLCGGETRERTGQYGVFYGCKRYPDCKGTWKDPSKARSGGGGRSSGSGPRSKPAAKPDEPSLPPESSVKAPETVPCRLCTRPIVFVLCPKPGGAPAKVALDPKPKCYFIVKSGESTHVRQTKLAMVDHRATCSGLTPEQRKEHGGGG